MTPSDQTELRNKLKDEIEVLLRDYLRDNLGNWHTEPTPELIERYLSFHMPGYTREAFAKLFDRYAAAAEQRARIDEQARPITYSLDTNASNEFKAGFREAVTQADASGERRIAELEQSLRKEQR